MVFEYLYNKMSTLYNRMDILDICKVIFSYVVLIYSYLLYNHVTTLEQIYNIFFYVYYY